MRARAALSILVVATIILAAGAFFFLSDQTTASRFTVEVNSADNGYFYYGSPAVDDRFVYVGTSAKWHAVRDEGRIPDNFLLMAVDKLNGTIAWSADLGRAEVINGPMLVEDMVLVSARPHDGQGYRVNVSVMAFGKDDGSLRWSTEVVEQMPALEGEQPADRQWLWIFRFAGLAWDGEHLLAGGDAVHRLDPADGTVMWSSSALSGPQDNVNQIVISGEHAYAVTRGGVDRVHLGNGSVEPFSPSAVITPWQASLTASGDLIVGASGAVHRIAADGTLLWTYDTGGQDVRSQPAVAADGSIFAGTKANQQSYFFKLSADGEELWRVEVGADLYSSPTLGDDGNVYVGSERWGDKGGAVHVIDADSGDVVRRIIVGGDVMWTSPALDGGLLYVGAMAAAGKGKLAAYDVEAQGLADSPWPTRDRNLLRNGSVG